MNTLTKHYLEPKNAAKYGPIAALLLQNISYWVGTLRKKCAEDHVFNDELGVPRYWTRLKLKDMRAKFPYLTGRQIEWAILSLETCGEIISGVHNRHKYDRSKWYTINSDISLFHAAVEVELKQVVNGNVEIDATSPHPCEMQYYTNVGPIPNEFMSIINTEEANSFGPSTPVSGEPGKAFANAAAVASSMNNRDSQNQEVGPGISAYIPDQPSQLLYESSSQIDKTKKVGKARGVHHKSKSRSDRGNVTSHDMAVKRGRWLLLTWISAGLKAPLDEMGDKDFARIWKKVDKICRTYAKFDKDVYRKLRACVETYAHVLRSCECLLATQWTFETFFEDGRFTKFKNHDESFIEYKGQKKVKISANCDRRKMHFAIIHARSENFMVDYWSELSVEEKEGLVSPENCKTLFDKGEFEIQRFLKG